MTSQDTYFEDNWKQFEALLPGYPVISYFVHSAWNAKRRHPEDAFCREDVYIRAHVAENVILVSYRIEPQVKLQSCIFGWPPDDVWKRPGTKPKIDYTAITRGIVGR